MKRIYRICQLSSMLLVIAALLLSSWVLRAYSDDNVKNVLILNSYHEGLSWTNQQTDGILDTLKELDIDCSVSVEYMDWKNYPTEENSKNLYDLLKYKYQSKYIDVIITTDYAALDFALKNRAALLFDAPIVFCGVNKEGVRKLTQGYSRVTGVTEIVDPENTVKAALKIKPDTKEIYVIFDNTESGLSTGAMTIQAIKNINPNIKINTVNKKSLMDILLEVGEAPDDSIALITTYYSDYYGRNIGFEEFSRKVSIRSKVPVFHLYDFGIGNGAIGGSMLSGRLQGEGAGKIAQRILNGEQISQIPVEASQNTRYVFDFEQLARFNIPLDKIPAESEVINKPSSFFEDHKSIVIMAVVIFSILVVFIIVLAFYLGKLNNTRKELQKSNEGLIESRNKLKEQYDELVSVQRSLTSSENRFSLLSERMLNGFFIFEPVTNKDGKIIDIRFLNANPGVKLQTGMSSKEVIGKTWTEVFKYPNNNLSIYHKILRSGEPKHFETYYPEGNKYYLINAFKISDNQVGTVFENITEYKQAIKKITMLNEELEQRVADRTEELQSAVNELEAFTYTVSHDLKSPLRAVDGYSRIVLEDFKPRLGEEASEMIQNIRSICSDMIEMINRLLQYSTTSKAAICKEDINSEMVFKSIFNEILSANPDRDLKLNIETGLPIILGDKVMIRQVVYNILSNAVKFTKHRGQALIAVGCTITGEEYIFYVKDNGVGLDMEFSKKLFGIFQRLHTNDEFEGSGIGLVTVKKIIHKHGGRVWIEGKAGVGATVYFTLPMEW
jgi:signal transduction histidine kinase/ABC-type uncharacterized transport system substrate-binding protein